MSRESTPRHTQTAGDLGFAVQFNAETFQHLMLKQFNAEIFRAAPQSSGRIVLKVTIGRVTPFISRERLNVKHSIVGYLRLPRPTLMRVLHWLRC